MAALFIVMTLSARRRSADSTDKANLAAEYVRMSTDHQQYSTQNQHDAIQRFADNRGFTIVRSYVDSGKSGVGIQGRDALQDLLRTVESGQADFGTILVYDVSRWGRFQEPDEGAYYEYRCLRAGIRVLYCAEQFPTDNAPMGAVMKSLKRAMAGEYSRELSAKVFAGQCRLITLGFRQGGSPGYGLRRLLLDHQGRPKAVLAPGERKSFQLDRVILTPGPDDEVAAVRRIYDLFLHEHSETQIARRLNEEGISCATGRPWTRGTVREILTNEKYIGNNVYNRTSAKLQKPRTVNDPNQWVRCNNAYTPIIDPETFARVQRVLYERDRQYTEEELLERLRAILHLRGKLSAIIIDETDDLPSAATYAQRFGGLTRAYYLIGYNPRRDYAYLEVNRLLRQLHRNQTDSIITDLQSVGAAVTKDAPTGLLTINGQFTTGISLARCRRLSEHEYRWILRFDTSRLPDITIAARMMPDQQTIMDYYLFPSIDVVAAACRLHATNPLHLDVYRTNTLQSFYTLATPSPLPLSA
jgi:DNA invertase Pin-like site-specific DNA recombinase